MPDLLHLLASPDYFPLAHGRYDVAAGLKPLGDKLHFEIDAHYLVYLAAKAASRREDPSKYHLMEGFSPEMHRAIASFAAERLAAQHPAFFAYDGTIFRNRLLGLVARIDWVAGCVGHLAREAPLLPSGEAVYTLEELEGASPIDFLALQTQEDWAVTAVDPATGEERLRMLHLSFPNHWSPADKIGRPFAEVHAPVAGIGPLMRAAASIVEAMIHKGPWERFAWGVATDTMLNHHPDNPDDPARQLPDYTPASAGSSSHLRIERQVLQGFPAHQAALFLIRTYFTPVAGLNAERRRALAQALRGMTPASLAYKGLVQLQPPLVTYLEQAAE